MILPDNLYHSQEDNMNKNEFIAKLAEGTGLKKSEAERFLDVFIINVKEIIANDDKLQLIGFGTFEAKQRDAKEGINPATKEKISIPACKVPAFKASKAFKEELNK